MRSFREVARIAFTSVTPTNLDEVFMARIALVGSIVIVFALIFGTLLVLLGGA